jgi:phage baseplate assembly protein W
MAQIIKRVHPFDTRQNMKIGVAFPLDKTSLQTGTDTIKEQIRTNLISLLVTYPGERLNLPDYGVGIQELLFENKIDKEILKSRIQNQAERWMENILITDVDISADNETGTIFIGVYYVCLVDGSEDMVTVAGS